MGGFAGDKEIGFVVRAYYFEMEGIAMRFKPRHMDFTLSPYTGLTRESWIEAGEYMLRGIFQHIKSFDDPVVVPRQETKITYPHLNEAGESPLAERKAEMFEGLTRSLSRNLSLMATS